MLLKQMVKYTQTSIYLGINHQSAATKTKRAMAALQKEFPHVIKLPPLG